MSVSTTVRRVPIHTLLALAALLVSPPPSGADPGDLSDAGCIQDAGGTDCIATADGLNGAISVAVSPDGTSAYTVSSNSDAIVTFVRDPDGALTDAGCIQNTGGLDCLGTGGTFRGLNGPSDVAVSPDGQNVYVASTDGNAVVVFTRANDGTLTPTACFRDSSSSSYCDGMGTSTKGLRAARALVVSPDGQNVYVASTLSDAVVIFDRAEDGSLTQAGCIQNTGGTSCTGIGGTTPGLNAAYGIAISPDGENVYVVSNTNDSIVTFDRAEDGTLTPAGCIQDTGGVDCNGSGGTTPGLDGPRDVTVSPDGATVYVAAHLNDAVLRFTRAMDGTLTPAGCVQNTGGADCGAATAGLDGAAAVAVSPEGQSLYVASINSDAVAVFDRAMDGSLTSAGCIQDTGLVDCTNAGGSTAAALNGAIDTSLSPDGSTVYVASFNDDAVLVFERELPPTTTTTTLPVTTTTLPVTTTTLPVTTTTLPVTTTTLPVTTTTLPVTTTTLPVTTTTLPVTTTTLPVTTTTLPVTTTTLPVTTTTLPVTTTTLPVTTTTLPVTTTTLPVTTTTLPVTTTTLPVTTTTLPVTTTTVPVTTTTVPVTTTTMPVTTTTLPATTTTTMMVTTTTLPPPDCGDVNRSGSVTSVDALTILKAAVGGPQCDEYPCACDVAGGGTVMSSDAQRALRIAVGIPDAPLCNCGG